MAIFLRSPQKLLFLAQIVYFDISRKTAIFAFWWIWILETYETGSHYRYAHKYSM